MIALPPRTIAIILDTAFASRLTSVAERAGVWIVDSPENRPAIESLWTARRIRGATYDITVFRMIPGLTPEQHVDGVLRSLGKPEASDDPVAPIGAVEVYGTERTDALGSTFAKHGYGELEPVGDGFRARRGTR